MTCLSVAIGDSKFGKGVDVKDVLSVVCPSCCGNCTTLQPPHKATLDR